MKQVLALALILLLAGVALYLAERRPHPDQVTAKALVNSVADWQRDLSRIPLRATRLSDEEEIRIGDELAGQYQSTESIPDPETQATERYINQIGLRVAARAHRQLLWRFHLVPDRNLINAFALPGGHVFVGQGLADRMTSEDELAFVLGHEIEHIDHFHAVGRVQIAAQLKSLDLDAVADLAELPISLWQAGYSKDEELEADREGLRLAAAAGYSAQGALNLLDRWTKLRDEYVIHAETPPPQTPDQAISELAIEGLEGYFRTHPLPSERLAQARQVIAADRLPLNQPLKRFHVEYEIGSDVH
jgi:predicted Zn-dependent protease